MIDIDYIKLREYIYVYSLRYRLKAVFNITDILIKSGYIIEHNVSYYIKPIRNMNDKSMKFIFSKNLIYDKIYIKFNYKLGNLDKSCRYDLELLKNKGIVKDV